MGSVIIKKRVGFSLFFFLLLVNFFVCGISQFD